MSAHYGDIAVTDLEPNLDPLLNRITERQAENTALREKCRPPDGG